MPRAHFSILALTLGIALAPTLAHAQSPAVTFFTSNPQLAYFENNASDFNAASYNLGWEFQVNASTVVTALGFFTDPTLGLTESHAVGLYQVVPGAAHSPNRGCYWYQELFPQSPLPASMQRILPTHPFPKRC